MYTTISGFFENGQIILEEMPPTSTKTKVIVTFLEQSENITPKIRQAGSLKKLGQLVGKTYNIPDDFNEPLDDLKEYMQ